MLQMAMLQFVFEAQLVAVFTKEGINASFFPAIASFILTTLIPIVADSPILLAQRYYLSS